MVKCNNDGCTKTWDTDPILQVPCPDCEAGVGQSCKRPSGWSGPFVKPHKARDLLALQEGKYGECPLGRCPESLDEVDTDVPDRIRD